MRLVILSELNQMGAKQPGLVAPRDALGRINAQCIWRWPDGSTYTAHMN